VLSGETTNTNLIVFGLTRSGLELTIYRTLGICILEVCAIGCFMFYVCRGLEWSWMFVVLYFYQNMYLESHKMSARSPTAIHTVILPKCIDWLTFQAYDRFGCMEDAFILKDELIYHPYTGQYYHRLNRTVSLCVLYIRQWQLRP
jgi:hypothetical protein